MHFGQRVLVGAEVAPQRQSDDAVVVKSCIWLTCFRLARIWAAPAAEEASCRGI
jgi:hypothetical protein